MSSRSASGSREFPAWSTRDCISEETDEVSIVTSMGRLRQEDPKFKASLSQKLVTNSVTWYMCGLGQNM